MKNEEKEGFLRIISHKATEQKKTMLPVEIKGCLL